MKFRFYKDVGQELAEKWGASYGCLKSLTVDQQTVALLAEIARQNKQIATLLRTLPKRIASEMQKAARSSPDGQCGAGIAPPPLPTIGS